MQGCDCHEDDLLAGRTVECSMKGCRAKRLAGQLEHTRQELIGDRTAAQDGRFALIDDNEVVSALTHCISSLQTKFHWVHELPYLVWQAT